MSFLTLISPDRAEGPIDALYQSFRNTQGFVPNHVQAFSLRPDIREGWLALNRAITSNLSLRTYELVTFATARALRSSYCSLAHGKVMMDKLFDAETVEAIASNPASAPITDAERAAMRFAELIVHGADAITAADIEALRTVGYDDATIFDIAATAAARCFFSKLLDATGVRPDAVYHSLDTNLKETLTVGRPVADR